VLARQASRTGCAAQAEVDPVITEVWAEERERRRESERRENCMMYEGSLVFLLNWLVGMRMTWKRSREYNKIGYGDENTGESMSRRKEGRASTGRRQWSS
jgi:hypothetical protein